MKRAIKPLTLAVSLGVVFLNSISTAQHLDYLCFKASPLIRVNPLGNTIDEEPITDQSFDNGASSLLSARQL